MQVSRCWRWKRGDKRGAGTRGDQISSKAEVLQAVAEAHEPDAGEGGEDSRQGDKGGGAQETAVNSLEGRGASASGASSLLSCR